MTDLKHRILPTVQKPARYTGGEWGEIKKNLQEVRVRVAFCFPDRKKARKYTPLGLFSFDFRSIKFDLKGEIFGI